MWSILQSSRTDRSSPAVVWVKTGSGLLPVRQGSFHVTAGSEDLQLSSRWRLSASLERFSCNCGPKITSCRLVARLECKSDTLTSLLYRRRRSFQQRSISRLPVDSEHGPLLWRQCWGVILGSPARSVGFAESVIRRLYSCGGESGSSAGPCRDVED